MTIVKNAFGLGGVWNSLQHLGASPSCKAAARLAHRMDLSFQKVKAGEWCAELQSCCGYRPRLHVIATGECLLVMIESGLEIPKHPLLLLKFALVAVAENNGYLFGSNRAHLRPGDRVAFVHGQLFDVRLFKPRALVVIAWTLIRQTYEVLNRLQDVGVLNAGH